eukprot:CFRG4766T1
MSVRQKGLQKLSEHAFPDEFSFYLMCLSSLLAMASLSVVIPTVTIYSESLGAGHTFSGLIVGMYAITGAIFMIPMTALLRKTSFTSVMILSCMTGIVGHALYALAGLANLKILLLLSRAVLGSGLAVNFVRMYITVAVGAEHRTKAFFIYKSTQLGGYALGPLIGGMLYDVNFRIGDLVIDSSTSPAWFMAILYTITTLLFVFRFKEPSAEYKAYEEFRMSRAEASTINSMWEVSIQYISSTYWGFDVMITGLLMSVCMGVGIISTPLVMFLNNIYTTSTLGFHGRYHDASSNFGSWGGSSNWESCDSII